MTQKEGLGRKLKIDIFKNWVWKSEIDGFGTQNGVFWEVPEMEIVLKYILDYSATILARFSEKNIKFKGTSTQIKKNIENQ